MPDEHLLADWIRHAANDLISSRHLFEDLYPKQLEIAAYLSHQCAEKALKSFLVSQDVVPPKIHNLNNLFGLCFNRDCGFSEIEIDCQKLNPFGSVTRYPNELTVDEAGVKAAIERARKIYDFCVAKANAKEKKA